MKAVFQLVRLPAGFSAISNVFAAHILVTQANIQWGILSLSILASLCLYFGGMGLNDCFDYHDDRESRNNRPIPSGQLSLSRAWLISISLMLAGVLIALIVSFEALIVAVILAATILLYDSKILSPVPSSIVMGACRYLNWILAMAFVGLDGIAYELPLALFLYVTGLTLLSKAEVRTDTRKPLYQSILLFFLSVIVLISQAVGNDVYPLLPLFAVALFVGFLVKTLLPVSRDFTPSSVQSTIGKLVMGVIMVDASLLAVYGYPVLAVCILLLLVPGKSLGRWMYVS